SFLERNAALYVDVADLEAVRARIEARRDWEVRRETGASLDDDDSAAPPLDFADIEKKYDERLGGSAGAMDGDRYSSRSLRLALMLIDTPGFDTGRASGEALLDRVKADILALDPDRYAQGMRVGFTGDVAI